jgi:flagellar capping protein FliD
MMNTAEWIAIAAFMTPIVVAFGVVQVRMHSTQQSVGERISRLERSEDQQNARQTHLEDALHNLNAEVKAGFSRLEAMLTMLVRDRS